jgi:hypothetical protein
MSPSSNFISSTINTVYNNLNVDCEIYNNFDNPNNYDEINNYELEDLNINIPSVNLAGYNMNSYLPGDTNYINYAIEAMEEYDNYLYHKNKNEGDWQIAKELVKNNFYNLDNTYFMIDVLESLLLEYNVKINDIVGLHYLDENLDYFFPRQEAQFVIENIKVNQNKIPHFRIDTNNNYYILDSNYVLSEH